MRNEFDQWVKGNVPAGRLWAVRAGVLAAAGTATAAVWLSVVLMAGVNLPPGEPPVAAKAPVAAPVQTAAPAAGQRSVRYAAALPPVTVVGRRQRATSQLQPADPEISALPARTASADARIGMVAGGDNLRQ